MTSIVALSGIVHYYTQLYYFKAEQEQKKRENLAVKVTYLIFGCLAGLVHRQRGRSRVQAPSPATDPQMDSDSLLTLQSPLGLGHPFLGHLHRRVHALRGGLLAQRAGLQCRPTVDRELRRRSNRYY